MRMDQENRKKLETFWRRKLWLSLAAIGALGLAAWQVAVMQSNYDEVLVQESRELPEKVYQELVAEVQTDLPTVAASRMTERPDDEQSKRLRYCSAIAALGELGSQNVLSKLQTILKKDVNSISTCGMGFPYTSVETVAIIASGKIDDEQSLDILQAAFYQLPSLEMISELRRMLIANGPQYGELAGDYEQMIQGRPALEQLKASSRNLQLLKIWMRGGILNLDRTGKMYKLKADKLPGEQRANLSEFEKKTILEDMVSDEIIEHFNSRQYEIVKAASGIKKNQKKTMKMLTEVLQKKSLDTSSESKLKAVVMGYRTKQIADIVGKLMEKSRDRREIISAFQRLPLSRYLAAKDLSSIVNTTQNTSCIVLPSHFNQGNVNQAIVMNNGSGQGSMLDPMCEQNLNSPGLFKDALVHLKSSDHKVRLNAVLVLAALDSRIYGRQMVSPVIHALQSLHKTNLLPIEDLIYDQSIVRLRLIGILQDLVKHNMLTLTDRKAVMPALMLAYRTTKINPQETMDGYANRIRILRLIRNINEIAEIDRITQ
jgi:hypothetical protein